MRSANAPVNGDDIADEKVRQPRNNPAATVLPPSASTRNGAVGTN
jgi:hypothetical protein